MIDNATVYRAMTAIQKASYGDIEPTFEEMKTALEASMKEESGIIYTEVKVQVTTPLRLCQDCRFYLQTASKDPCEGCMKNTKGEAWQPK